MRYSESLLRARQEDTLAALYTLESGETTTHLRDARAGRLARRQSRLLDALRSLCDRHGLVVDVSPAALSSGVSTCTKAPVEPICTEPIVVGGKAGPTERRLHAELVRRGVRGARFSRVCPDYYSFPLEKRMSLLCAPSVFHLCKSILLENENAPASVIDCSDPTCPRYLLVIVQYKATLDVRTKLRDWAIKLSRGKFSKSKVKFRLAPDDVSARLTGYVHNAVSPVALADPSVPLVLSHHIAALQPDFFWLGGGEADLKLGFSCREFVQAYQPHVVNCTLEDAGGTAKGRGLRDDDDDDLW